MHLRSVNLEAMYVVVFKKQMNKLEKVQAICGIFLSQAQPPGAQAE